MIARISDNPAFLSSAYMEYLNVFKQKNRLFLIIFSAVFAAFVIFASYWSYYRSKITIQVVQPEISAPSSQFNDLDNPLIDLRINRLKQIVLSSESLSQIIKDLNLYDDNVQSKSLKLLASRMRSDIKIRLLSSSLASPISAQKASAQELSAIAFTIEFTYEDPLKAQQTVDELASRFLAEDLKERRQTSEKTLVFLQGQIDILTQSLEAHEAEIALFRAENGNIRPDLLNFNQQASAAANARLIAIESDLTANLGRIGALQSQLAVTEPYLTLIDRNRGEITVPAAVKLRNLEADYNRLLSRYSHDHPDVRRTARQIENLKSQEDVQQKENYSDANNPSYLQIITQLSAAQEQQQALLQQKHKLEQQKMTYSSAIAANPEAEQRLASLTRDYENMMTLYRDLKSRKLAADMNKTIENSQVGQRLIITEPASLPFVTEPSKKFIIACGFILALITGFGSIFTLHYLSGAINGVSHLKSVFGIIPLVRIPKLKKAKGSQNYPKLAANKIVAHQINNKQADIFRFLRTQILQKLKNNKYQSLAISSARYGDGKTTIASNLAVSIAQDLKQTVLLVDLDLRKASLANIFGLNAEVGLTNYLKGDALVKDCLIRPPFERITIFPAGNAIDNSSETIGSPQMEILAKELRERYEDRIIIYDMPPLLQQDDPLVFLPHVDAFLFVVREGVTQASEIERSLDILKKTNLLGVVVNDN